MMKIIASLVILGFCANVCLSTTFTGVAPVSSGQSGAFSSAYLNSTAVKIVNVGNATDAANWDSSATTNDGAGVLAGATWFVAGATNDTSYLFGLPSTGTTSTIGTVVATLRKRTINNTIAAWGNDTSEQSVIGDTTVAASIQTGSGDTWGTGPGYLAALSTGPDAASSSNEQVWVSIITASSGAVSSIKLTTTADVVASGSVPAIGAACTTTSFTVGDIWYDWDSEAFWYTYSKLVTSTPVATSAGTCGTGTSTNAYTIYLGATYANGSTYWATPLAITPVTVTHAVSNLISGVDNSNFASYVYVVYKDAVVDPGVIYISKTTISTNTSTAGSFSALVTEPATTGTSGASTVYSYTYTPSSVWSSNFTYGVAVSVANYSQTVAQSATTPATYTYVYSVLNFLNGTTTGVDSGLSFTAAAGTPMVSGFQLNTGYGLVGAYSTSTGSAVYQVGTFFANGTVNSTAATVATFTYGAPQFYEDVNGTVWTGWLDVDTANSAAGNGQFVYAAYLAKFIGQVNIDGANVLSALSAIVAFVLASIFVF